MRRQPVADSQKPVAIPKSNLALLQATSYKLQAGFTLVETLAAVTLLAVAIVAPMLLTVRSFTSAFYARDQITAFYLAQEGLEAIHQDRDNQIIVIAEGGSGNLFNAVAPFVGTNFQVDATTNAFQKCNVNGNNVCPPLETDGTLYGYHGGWQDTNYTRTMTACYVQASGTCTTTASDEIRITSEVDWHTASLSTLSVTVSEDLYRWIAS